MKQQIILWLGASIILFLIVYFIRITSEDYPLSGIISIDNHEVLYKFNKTHYTGEAYLIEIHTALSELRGDVVFKKSGDSLWSISLLYYSDQILKAAIPASEMPTKIDYMVRLYYKNKTYMLPATGLVRMNVRGKVPSFIEILCNTFLFGGLLLSIRTGLELFSQENHSIKLMVLSLLFFLGYLIFDPLRISYQLSAINKFVPDISQLFDIHNFIFILIWLAVIIFFKRIKKRQLLFIVAAVLIVINYYLSVG